MQRPWQRNAFFGLKKSKLWKSLLNKSWQARDGKTHEKGGNFWSIQIFPNFWSHLCSLYCQREKKNAQRHPPIARILTKPWATKKTRALNILSAQSQVSYRWLRFCVSRITITATPTHLHSLTLFSQVSLSHQIIILIFSNRHT